MFRTFVCVFFGVFAAFGATHTVDHTRQELNQISQTLNQIRVELLDLSNLSKDILDHQEAVLKSSTDKLNRIRINSEKDLLTVENMLSDLGPAPGPDDIPEDPEMSSQRTQLNERVAFYHNRIKRTKALLSRAESLLLELTQVRLKLQVYRLKKRSSPIYKLQGEEEGFAKVVKLFSLKKESSAAPSTKKAVLFGLLFMAVITTIILIRKPIKGRYVIADNETSDIFKIKKACADFIADGLTPLVCIFLAVFYLHILELFPKPFYTFILSLALLAGSLWAYVALIKILVRPYHAAYRFIHIEQNHVMSLYHRLSWTGPLLALTLWFYQLEIRIDLPEDFADYLRFGLQTALCLNLLFLLDSKIYSHFQRFSKLTSTLLRYSAGIILLAVPVLLFIGYLALAEYLLFGLLKTAALIAGLLIGFIFVRALIETFITQSSPLFKRFSIKQRNMTLLQYWIKGFFALCFWLGAIISLLFIWGIGSSYVTVFLNKLLYGFEISGHRISITLIAIAIVSFCLALFVIRICMQFLDKHVFPYTNMQKGLAEAVKTMIRYVLITIAFILCIRLLGFKLTSFAYIAGGLSVGVGLGLQPIIMNFISGIIMLIERPVRVGDSLEVSGESGIVTKISVRATYIRTFEHAQVMVPNSQLITNTVKNWTHENTVRRISIPVSVAYGSDVEKVKEVLLEAAKELDLALVQPAPVVVFDAFGDSNLEFILRVYIADTAEIITAKTLLNTAIEKKLKANHIAIAYPQMDVHLSEKQRK